MGLHKSMIEGNADSRENGTSGQCLGGGICPKHLASLQTKM
jgi:hypothetical protein